MENEKFEGERKLVAARTPLLPLFLTLRAEQLLTSQLFSKRIFPWSRKDWLTVKSLVLLNPVFNCDVLSHFTPVTKKHLRSVISRSKLTSACVDPILMKIIIDCHCQDIVIPVIPLLINTSLLKGTIPKPLKCAAVKPLQKKRGLDPNVAKNYQPMSNLPFMYPSCWNVCLQCSWWTTLINTVFLTDFSQPVGLGTEPRPSAVGSKCSIWYNWSQHTSE